MALVQTCLTTANCFTKQSSILLLYNSDIHRIYLTPGYLNQTFFITLSLMMAIFNSQNVGLFRKETGLH